MVLVGISVLPHGTMILDLSMYQLPNIDKVTDLNAACIEASKSIAQTNPETIILFTPHGISLNARPCLYLNKLVKGNAGWNGLWENYSACATCDQEMARELCNLFQCPSTGYQMDGLTAFAGGCAAPLAWGEVVPMHFTQSLFESGVEVVICCWPQLRHDPVHYAPQAMAIGERIYEYAHQHKKRISLMFSADLSHVHGIDPGAPAIYQGDPSLGCDKPLAESFDGMIVQWMGHLIRGECTPARELLLSPDHCLGIISRAKVCGWAGLCAIQGCMNKASAAADSSNTTDITMIKNTVESSDTVTNGSSIVSCPWSGRVWEYAAPTYYGMMVATIEFRRDF